MLMLSPSLAFFALRGFIFGGIRAIQAIKYKNLWLENILAHGHLWHGSTQIEYSSQKMAEQV